MRQLRRVRKFGNVRGAMADVLAGGTIDRNTVRVAATRALLRILAQPDPDEIRLPDGPFCPMLLAGHDERGIAAALELTLDEVRAMLIRLAR